MKKLNRMVLVIAFSALAMMSATAQERQGRKHDLGVYKELVATLKTWAKTNVVPQLRTWKGKLDAAMTADDLAKLNALRARASQLKKEAIATGLAMHEAWKAENYEALKEAREKMKGYKEQRNALFVEVKPLAVKYSATLQAIGAEAKPKVAAWKEEGKAVALEWIADHKEELGNHPLPNLHRMRGMMGFGGGMRKKVIVAYFMLWDGGDFIDDLEQFGAEGSSEHPDLD